MKATELARVGLVTKKNACQILSTEVKMAGELTVQPVATARRVAVYKASVKSSATARLTLIMTAI